MIEEVAANLFRVEIPLPDNPLRAINSYIVKSDSRNLIIDTGMNREECLAAMEAALSELKIDLKKTDIYLTHVHSDHTGLAPYLSRFGSRVFFSRIDADYINDPRRWDNTADFLIKNGFITNGEDLISAHPGFKYAPQGQVDFTMVEEGDKIRCGDYDFSCVFTPGHTNGHMCLYEAEKKILISGDHVLFKITPNISLWNDDDNPLKDFLASLEKVALLDVATVLPAHRKMLCTLRERVTELKSHHERRLNHILSVLDRYGAQNAFDIAAQIPWDMSYKDWDEFPTAQKIFAVSEVLSHLKWLEDESTVAKHAKNGIRYYSLNKAVKIDFKLPKS